MFSIEKSDQFQKEMNDFKLRTSKLGTSSDKELIESMIANLTKSVKLLDQQHNDFPLSNRMPPIVLETRENINNLRQNIHKKLKDLESSTNNQSV